MTNISAHDALDQTVVASRTCPYENDKEQRIAKFSEMIYQVTNNIPFSITRDEFETELYYLFNGNDPQHIAVIFPETISESQSFFTYPLFLMGGLDMTKHSGWFSMKAMINGSDPGDPEPSDGYYGNPSNISFYDFLQQLPFAVKIVNGLSYYQCDEIHSWGFNQANIYIKEPNDGNCPPTTHIGTAEVYTTFKSTNNSFGEEEWLMEEYGIMFDIYATQEPVCQQTGNTQISILFCFHLPIASLHCLRNKCEQMSTNGIVKISGNNKSVFQNK